MTMSDPISDLLSRIRNAHMAGHYHVECLASRMGERILAVLKDEGYILGFKREKVREGIDKIIVDLKYFEGLPAIKELKRSSKPGRRMYSPIQDLKKNHHGLGTVVLSTSKGVLSDAKAREMNVGGEVLFEIF